MLPVRVSDAAGATVVADTVTGDGVVSGTTPDGTTGCDETTGSERMPEKMRTAPARMRTRIIAIIPLPCPRRAASPCDRPGGMVVLAGGTGVFFGGCDFGLSSAGSWWGSQSSGTFFGESGCFAFSGSCGAGDSSLTDTRDFFARIFLDDPATGLSLVLPIIAPHEGQKRDPGSRSVPQREQEGGGAIRAPQASQNGLSAGAGALHRGQDIRFPSSSFLRDHGSFMRTRPFLF